MNLFPIGKVASKLSTGIIDSISYSMNEPNSGCHSYPSYSVLVTPFQDQTMQTRKKALPHLIISYTYDNIFHREYQQIEHFIDYVDEALTSFYIVDFSKGFTPDTIASAANAWSLGTDNTRLYTTIANQKANKIFVWDGTTHWKLGDVSTIVTNATITISLANYHRGGLKYSRATSIDVVAYPVYEAYLSPNVLSGFKPTEYWREDMGVTENGGYMRSGIVSFISKYSV